MKWDNLTMSQKQALMKIYVNNGVTNLDEIVNHYNRFAEGGPVENIELPKTNDRPLLHGHTSYIDSSSIPNERLNLRPAPGLLTDANVGAGINLPFKELIDRFVLEKINTPNIINTDSINRPSSYITRPRRINRFDDGGYTKNLELPEIIVTPRGNYTEYNSTTSYIPTKKEYIDSRLEGIKIDAVNRFINQKDGILPEGIPSRSLLSRASGVILSDAARIKLFGEENRADKLATCINTATSMYDLPELKYHQNKQFVEDTDAKISGYIPVSKNRVNIGDLITFKGYDGNTPHHSGMITGFDENGEPVITYSDGGVEDAVQVDSDSWKEDFAGEEYSFYRPIGKVTTLRRFLNEYDEKFIKNKK